MDEAESAVRKAQRKVAREQGGTEVEGAAKKVAKAIPEVEAASDLTSVSESEQRF